MTTITFQAKAYKPTYDSVEEVEAGKVMPYVWTFDDETHALIGTAVVTVTLFEKEELHRRQLDKLNEQLKATRAENQQRENAILLQISKLTAIGYTEAA